MLRKIISIFAVSLSCIQLAHANYNVPTVYIAPSLAYQDFYQSNADNYTGITGKIAVGGSIGWEYAYLGAEGFYSFKPLNSSSGSSASSFRPSKVYGFDVLPGWNLDGVVLAYLRLGVAWANFSSLNATPRGYQIGPGIEWALYPHVYLRGDVIYTRYNAITGTGSINCMEGALGINFRLAD